MHSYKNLTIWRRCMDLVEKVYLLTRKLPKSETFNLISQTQRSAISMPSNIAEGSKRNHKAEFLHFLSIASGSAAELETQIMLIKRLYPELSSECDEILDEIDEILKMVYVYAKKLNQ